MRVLVLVVTLLLSVYGLERVDKPGQYIDIAKDKFSLEEVDKVKTEVGKIEKEIDFAAIDLERRVENFTCEGVNDDICPYKKVSCTATYEEPDCGSGKLNPYTHMCETDPIAKVCPDGWEYKKELDICVKTPKCPGGGTYNKDKKRCELQTSYDCNVPVIAAASGYEYKNKERYIRIGDDNLTLSRGWCVAVLSKIWAKEDVKCFDTHKSLTEANKFADFLESIPKGKYVVIVTWDEPRDNVYNNEKLIGALRKVGATESVIRSLEYRSAYALIGQKGNTIGTTIDEKYSPRDGSTIYVNNYSAGYHQEKDENGNIICVKDVDCAIGKFNKEKDRCELTPIYNCVGGNEYKYDHNLSAGADKYYCDNQKGYYINKDKTLCIKSRTNIKVEDVCPKLKRKETAKTPVEIDFKNDICKYEPAIGKCPFGYEVKTVDGVEKCVARAQCNAPATIKTTVDVDKCSDGGLSFCEYGDTYVNYDGYKDYCIGPLLPDNKRCDDLSGYKLKVIDKKEYCVRDIECLDVQFADYNKTADRCERKPYSKTTGACVLRDESKMCPKGTTLNGDRGDDDRCERAIQDDECPKGYHWDKGLDHCVKDVVCPDGGTLNPNKDRCEIKVSDTNTCPDDPNWKQIFENGHYLCVITKEKLDQYCPESGKYVSKMKDVYGKEVEVHRCTLDNTKRYCPDGSYAPNNDLRLCIDSPVCPPNSHYDNKYKRCITTVSHTCPPGEYGIVWEYNETTFKCQAKPMCPPGTEFNSKTNRCERDIKDSDCPTGYHWDKTLDHCVKDVVCPGKGQLNPKTDRCEYPVVLNDKNCDTAKGFHYNKNTKRCERTPLCSGGGKYDDKHNLCYKPLDGLRCKDNGYTFDKTLNKCVKAPDCGDGYYDKNADVCVGQIKDKCDKNNGYTYNATTKQCERRPVCPDGTKYVDSRNRCEQIKDLSKNCPSGYSWDKKLNYCAKDPICPDGGKLNKTKDRCEKSIQKSDACPGGDWKKVQENGKYLCIIEANKLDKYCPDGGKYSTSYHRCYKKPKDDEYFCKDTGYSPDTTYNKCIKTPDCSGADLGYDGNYKRCTQTASHECPDSGYSAPYVYTYDEKLMKCTMSPKCDDGLSYDPDSDRCEVKVTSKLCPSGEDILGKKYAYTFNNDQCEKSVNCPFDGEFVGGDVDKCRKPAQNNKCPDGYTPDGDRCIYTPVCPNGGHYDFIEKKCKLDKQQKEFCSDKDGYTIASDRSVCYHEYDPKNNTDVTAACGSPNGYNLQLDLQNNRCIYIAHSGAIECDTAHGYDLNDTYLKDYGIAWCEKRYSTGKLNPTDNCPFFASGITPTLLAGDVDKCIVDPMPKCPAGYSPGAVDGNNNECQREVTTDEDCPSGYIYNASTNKCEKTINSPYTTVYDNCTGSGCVQVSGDKSFQFDIEYWSDSPFCNDHDTVKITWSSIGRTIDSLYLYYNSDTFGNLSKIILQNLGVDVNSITDDSDFNKKLQKWWMNFSCGGTHYGPVRITVYANVNYWKKHYCNDGVLVTQQGVYKCLISTNPRCTGTTFGNVDTTKDKCYTSVAYMPPPSDDWTLDPNDHKYYADIICPYAAKNYTAWCNAGYTDYCGNGKGFYYKAWDTCFYPLSKDRIECDASLGYQPDPNNGLYGAKCIRSPKCPSATFNGQYWDNIDHRCEVAYTDPCGIYDDTVKNGECLRDWQCLSAKDEFGNTINPVSDYSNNQCYTQKMKSCDEERFVAEYKTPNYPNSYPDNYDSGWIVKKFPGAKSIKVVMNGHIEASYDFIYVGQSKSDFRRYSGYLNHTITINGDTVYYRFTSDQSYHYNGCDVKFYAKYSENSVYKNLSQDGYCYSDTVDHYDTNNYDIGYADVCPSGSFNAKLDRCIATGGGDICYAFYSASYDGNDDDGSVCYKNAHCKSGDSNSYTWIDKASDRCVVDTTKDYCTLPGYVVDWKENKSTKAHPSVSDPGNKNICYQKNEPYCSGSDPSRYFDENIYDGKCAENLQNRCNYTSGKYSWDENIMKCIAKPDCPNNGNFIVNSDRCRLDVSCHDGLYTGTDASLNVCFTKDRSGNGYVPDGANTVKGLGYDNYDSCPNGNYSKTDNVCNGGRDVCDDKNWILDNSVDTCYTSYNCPGESYFKNLGDGSSEAKKDKCYEYKDKICKRYKLNGKSYFYDSSQDRCEYNNPYCSGNNKTITMEKGNIDKCTETPEFICDSKNGYAHIVRTDFTDAWGAHNRCEKAKDCLGGNFDDVVKYDSTPDKDLCYMDRVIECDSKNNYVPEYYKKGTYPDGADTNDYGDICKWTGDLNTLCKNGRYNGNDKFNECDAGQDVCKEYRLSPIFSIDKCVQKVSCGLDDTTGNWFDSVKDMCYHDTYVDVCNAASTRDGIQFVLNWAKSNTTAPHKAHWSEAQTKNVCYEDSVPECRGSDPSVTYDQNITATADGKRYEGLCVEDWKNDCPAGYDWVDSLDKCVDRPDCPNGGQFDDTGDRCKVAIGCNFSGSPKLYNSLDAKGKDSVCYTGLTANGQGYVPDGDNIPQGMPSYDACPNGHYNGDDRFNVCDAGQNICKGLNKDFKEDKCYVYPYCGVNDPVANPNKFDPYGKDFYNKDLNRCVSGVYINCQGGIGINPKTGKMENCDIKEPWCTPFEYSYDEELCIATNVSCGSNQYDDKKGQCYYYAKEVGCRTDLGYTLNQPDPTDQSKDECYIQDIKKMTQICKNKDNFTSIDTSYDTNLTAHKDYNSTVIKEHVIFSRLYNACATGWDENQSRGYLGHVCPDPVSFGYVFKFRKYINIDGTPPKEGITDKCMMAPICHDGVWNPNNNGCYLGDFTCPLGPEYECRKMSETPLPDPNDPDSFIEDRWCSPIDCHNKKCRVAKCNNQPKQDPKHPDWCYAKECDGYEPYTQCGKFECPADAIKKQFGDKFKCYKLVCPDNSFIENGRCYEMKCPSDAIEENGKCYRD